MPSGVRRRKHERSKLSKNTRRVKSKHSKINIQSNAIIAEHWDPKLTLSQNYKKLGLRSKLGHRAGGEEKEIKIRSVNEEESESDDDEDDKQDKLEQGEGRIIRHDDGTVTIEYGGGSKNEDDDDDDENNDVDHTQRENTTEVVRKLEALANSGVTKPRVQSEREQDWISRLIEKHGENYEAMFWDKKLNIHQQSIGDIKRRIFKWKKSQGKA